MKAEDPAPSSRERCNSILIVMTPASKLLAREMRRAFAAEIAGPDESIRLVSAALLVAAEDEAHLDVDIPECLRRLDSFGRSARQRIAAAPGAVIEAFNDFIFEEEGFAGNQLDYYDPANSYLNRVLERRVGIPLTLSIVYMEVGRRAGLLVEGIGLPGHFIVRARERNAVESILVDPFHGKVVTPEDYQDQLDEVYGHQVALTGEHLRAATKREILARLLTNLKAIYTRANLHRQTLAVIDRLLLLMPLNAGEHRDHGHVLAQLERLPEAIDEMQTYLQMQPHAADAETVREQLHALKRQHAMRN
jgi:regulator of sirC expression with transglutaminase-like and TPR domain